MLYLILSILLSALIAIIMRCSERYTKNGNGMLIFNYVMCIALSACFTRFSFGEGFGFVGCTTLRQIVLSDNIETMWAGVFAGTSLTSVRTPLSWQEVYDVPSPFGGCTTLKEVIFPEGVTAIPPYAFVSATSPDIDLPTTSIERIILPSTLKEIGYMAFAGTSISSIELPEGLEALSNFVFSDCVKLTSVTLPNSLTTMGSFAFTGTRLTSVQTPTHWSKVAYYNWDDGDYV